MKKVCLINYTSNNQFFQSHEYVDFLFWENYFKNKSNFIFNVFCPENNVKKETNYTTFKPSRKNNIISTFFKLLKIPKSDLYIFQSYYELHALLWLIATKIPFKNNNIYFVATNNISAKRMSYKLLKFFYFIFKIYKVKIFIGSSSEKLLLESIFSKKNIIIKKYHFWAEVLGISEPKIKKSEVLFYPGPSKIDKPVNYFKSLSNYSKKNNNKFNDLNHILFNITSSELSLTNQKYVEKSKLSFKDLAKQLSSSKYIFLPHNFNFEGKFSGNFIDAIYFEVIIISNSINPVLEYFDDYGKLGIIINYDDPGWEIKLLDQFNNLNPKEIIANIKKVKKDHSLKSIYNSLDEVFIF